MLVKLVLVIALVTVVSGGGAPVTRESSSAGFTSGLQQFRQPVIVTVLAVAFCRRRRSNFHTGLAVVSTASANTPTAVLKTAMMFCDSKHSGEEEVLADDS